jgi:hypothetical protein
MIMNEKDLKNIFQSGICAIKRNARNKDIWNSILLLSQKFDNVFYDFDCEKYNIVEFMHEVLNAFLKHFNKRLTATQKISFNTAVICQMQAVTITK